MTTTVLDTPLAPGDQLRFAQGGAPSWWWDARAVSERYAVLTHQAPFEPKGTLIYTIIDWQRGVRGPCNLVGQGWDFGTDPDVDAARLLAALEGAAVVDDQMLSVEVSYRNNVPVGVLARRPITTQVEITERRSTGECSSCGEPMDLLSEDFWECGNGHTVDESTET